MVRVLVADDHPLFLGGVVRAIESAGDMALVAVATDGCQALKAILRERPDVALLDMRLPGLTGLEIVHELALAGSDVAVVFLSAFADGPTVHRALTAGALGYVSKEAGDAEICASVRAAARREMAVGPDLQALVVVEMHHQSGTILPRLSERERDVLQRVADGCTTPQISGDLFLSPATVKTYLMRAYDKLGVNDRAAAVAEAVRRGLIA